jgi:hypothetical protein
MVTKRWLEEKWLNPWLERQKANNFAKGRAEGRAKERRLWTEWNRRRMEAEARDVPFDELPPAP